MKIGNIVPRAGIEPIFLAFWVNMLPFHHVGPCCHHYSHSYLSMQLLVSEVRTDYYTCPPPGIVSFVMLTITYIQAVDLHIHTQVQQPCSTYLVQDPGHGTSVMGEMKMRNSVPRTGIKPTSLAFLASVLPLHHIGSLMSPLYPHLPVYAAPCLRDQCRLLHCVSSRQCLFSMLDSCEECHGVCPGSSSGFVSGDYHPVITLHYVYKSQCQRLLK